MPDLVIEQSTFERLQRHARPLVDTTDMVVNRALDALELHERSATQEVYQSIAERQINPRRLPDLTHTKVLDASLNGKRFVKPNWNQLVNQILIRAMKQFQILTNYRSPVQLTWFKAVSKMKDIAILSR